MPGFLYYIPGDSGRMTVENALALPCAYAFEDCKAIDSRGVLRGPADDQPAGLVIARSGTVPDSDMGLFLDRQIWTKMDQSDVWIGYCKSEDGTPTFPKPVDLARPRQIDGRPLKLGDGNEWIIPIARRLQIHDGDLVPYCALPMVSEYKNGTWASSGVRSQFRGLWDISNKYLTSFMSGKLEDDGRYYFEYDFPTMHESAFLALTTNYYVGRDEISILQLLDNEIAQAILNELIDMPTYVEFVTSKKN